MSGVYIPNMEMPKGCYECFLCDSRSRFDGNEWHCLCVALQKEVYDDGGKEEDCPLVKVPTHGDLKDTNKILQWLNRICDEGQSVSVGEIIDYIENAKTVIEAST